MKACTMGSLRGTMTRYSVDKDRAFASWAIDWSRQERSNEFVRERWEFGVGGTEREPEGEVRRPLFRAGGISSKRIKGKVLWRFLNIRGDGAMRFEEEINGGEEEIERNGGIEDWERELSDFQLGQNYTTLDERCCR